MSTAFPRSLAIPDTVGSIARRLDEAGHEVWCVGGAVRDNLLGEPNHDFDLATSATPDQVIALFRRTVPVGISLFSGEAGAAWHLIMATAILAMLPPVAVIVFMQRLFVRGLVEVEK